MDVFVVVQTVLRRWWVVLPTLALTAGAVALVLMRVEPEYEATASLLLAAPELTQVPGEEAAEGAPASAAVIAEIVQGDEVRDRLAQGGASADYLVEVTGDGSILRVVATDASQSRVVPTVEAVLAAIDETVAERVGAQQDVRLDVLSRPSQARAATVPDADGGTSTVYEATGSVRLLGLGEDGAIGANPYVASGGTLRVLQEVAASPEARGAVLEGERNASFNLHMENRDAAPILYVSAQGTDPDGVMRTLDRAVTYLNDVLLDRQQQVGAPESTWIRLEPLSMPAAVTQLSANVRRPVLMIAGLGMIAAVSLALLVDNLMLRRGGGRSPTGNGSPGERQLGAPPRRRYEQVP